MITGLNLRVSPNDGRHVLALAVMLAPPLDNPQELSVLGQQRYQVVTCAALYSTTIVVQSAKHLLDRDPLQQLPQDLGDLLAGRQQYGIESNVA